MAKNKTINQSLEEYEPKKKRRTISRSRNKNIVQALKEQESMEKSKTLNRSQEEDESEKKHTMITRSRIKNNVQPETKTETRGSCVLLPLDIVAEILSRLPASCIAKFRYVCKQWFSLTNDPCFLKLRNERLLSYIIIDKDVHEEIKLYECSIVEDGKRSLEISHKCNFGRTYYTLSNFVNGITFAYGVRAIKSDLYLLNPMTRELQKLPENNLRRQERSVYQSFSLGIDMTTGKYKVVRFFCPCERSRYEKLHVHCKIYTVGTTQWRYLGEAPFLYYNIFNNVQLDGDIYQIGYVAGGDHQEETRAIFRFDIKDEKFSSAISIPDPDDMYLYCLKESRGNLCLLFRRQLEDYFEIWTIKDCVSKTWVKEYTFYIDILSSVDQFNVIEIFNGEVLLKVCNGSKWHVICYNLCSGAVRELFDGEVRYTHPGNFAIFRESLISPKKLM